MRNVNRVLPVILLGTLGGLAFGCGPGGGPHPKAALTATDARGAAAAPLVALTAANSPQPSVTITSPTAGSSFRTGTNVIVTAQASLGTPPYTNYAWSFGDGTTGSGASVTRSYAVAGSDTATVTVTDSRGLTATASMNFTITDPPFGTDPPAGSRPVITAADLKYLGGFRLMPSVNFNGTTWGTSYSKCAFAFRRMPDGAKRFFACAHEYSDGLVYEVGYPGLSSDPNPNNWPTAPLVKAWGDIYGSARPYDKTGSGHQETWGLYWFKGDANLPQGLFWGFGVFYLGQAGWPSFGFTRIDDANGGTARPLKSWTLKWSRSYRQGGVLEIPAVFAKANTGGRTIGVGFGGAYSSGSNDLSNGPCLFAVSTADMVAQPHGAQLDHESLLYKDGAAIFKVTPYNVPQPAHRDPDSRNAVFGNLDAAAPSTTVVHLPSVDCYQGSTSYNGKYAGYPLVINGETRKIVAYDGNTGNATVDAAFSALPRKGDSYEVTGYSGLFAWPARGGVGYFSGSDNVGQGVWIDGPNKQGLVYPVWLVKGRFFYRPGGHRIEGRKYQLWVYDPADLAAVHAGAKGPNNVQYANAIDLRLTGVANPDPGSGREVNIAFDPVDKILYIMANYVWGDPNGWYPAVLAFQVNC
jgi:hypothetical protein